MAFEAKPNSGSLFKNDRKETDTHPDYSGSGKIGNADVRINGWVKETSAGKKYLSLSFRRKDDSAAVNKSQPKPGMDDEIPF